jgi:hypothetical protein
MLIITWGWRIIFWVSSMKRQLHSTEREPWRGATTDCSNWLYVSLRRAGKEQEAAQVLTRITPEVTNTEPHLYFYLRLLRFYQGQLTTEAVLPPPPAGPEDLEGELAFDTVSYGIGNCVSIITTAPRQLVCSGTW